jgi:hypothetical protein
LEIHRADRASCANGWGLGVRKLDLHSVSELVRYAIRNRIAAP